MIHIHPKKRIVIAINPQCMCERVIAVTLSVVQHGISKTTDF